MNHESSQRDQTVQGLKVLASRKFRVFHQSWEYRADGTERIHELTVPVRDPAEGEAVMRALQSYDALRGNSNTETQRLEVCYMDQEWRWFVPERLT